MGVPAEKVQNELETIEDSVCELERRVNAHVESFYEHVADDLYKLAQRIESIANTAKNRYVMGT